jgi:hypothetical protein
VLAAHVFYALNTGVCESRKFVARAKEKRDAYLVGAEKACLELIAREAAHCLAVDTVEPVY